MQNEKQIEHSKRQRRTKRADRRERKREREYEDVSVACPLVALMVAGDADPDAHRQLAKMLYDACRKIQYHADNPLAANVCFRLALQLCDAVSKNSLQRLTREQWEVALFALSIICALCPHQAVRELILGPQHAYESGDAFYRFYAAHRDFLTCAAHVNIDDTSTDPNRVVLHTYIEDLHTFLGVPTTTTMTTTTG